MSCDLKSGVHVATTFAAALLQYAALGCSSLNGPHLSNQHGKQCRFLRKEKDHNPTCGIHEVCVCVESGGNQQMLVNI